MPERRRIAIIGGGASAVFFLAHLMQEKLSVPHDILIFDRTNRFARGIAYGTDRPEHLLNVRANNMSAFANDPDHFYQWLQNNNHSYNKTDFVPRMIYGTYLTNIFEDFLKYSQQQNWTVKLLQENVTGIKDRTIITKDNHYKADTIIVATGNCMPFSPVGAEKLTAQDGYWQQPWNADYQKISGAKSVIILGTGLSMIDAVLSLHKANYKGKITAISRRALVPATHVDPVKWPNFIHEFPKTLMQLLRLIRTQVQLAKAQDIRWQAVIDSLRPVTNDIYLSWSEQEQRKTRRLLGFWKIHRHRMPPEAAAIIEEYKKNHLSFVKENVLSVGKAGGKLIVTGKSAQYEADHVINCLGYGEKHGLTPFPKEIPLPENERADFYALGPALTGYYFETTAIPEIRAQAAMIADKIIT